MYKTAIEHVVNSTVTIALEQLASVTGGIANEQIDASFTGGTTTFSSKHVPQNPAVGGYDVSCVSHQSDDQSRGSSICKWQQAPKR